MKYSENEILKEISDYISGTYSGHYSTGGVQTLDLIDSVGDAEAFCRSNILKYASRYDRKGTARNDRILKEYMNSRISSIPISPSFCLPKKCQVFT